MSNPNMVLERVKWLLLFVFSIVFLLWIMFGTQSPSQVSEESSATNQQDENTVSDERQFQSQLTIPEDNASNQTEAAASGSISDYQVFLNVDGVWGEADISEETGIKDYLFTHSDGSTIRISISLAELNEIAADYAWQHTPAAVEDGYNIDFVVESDQNTTLCEEGSSGCSAGNGILDITSVNESTEDGGVFVRVVVKDTEQDISEAENYYKNIIETIQVKRQET